MGAKNTIVLITALFTGMVLALQTGIALASFGAKGSRPGQFDFPIAVAIAPNGNVFVADYGNNGI